MNLLCPMPIFPASWLRSRSIPLKRARTLRTPWCEPGQTRSRPCSIRGSFRLASILLCTLLVMGVPGAYGGGFLVGELSARGTGMGGILTPLTDNPTSIYVNPAALSFLQGTHLSLGTTVTLPDFGFTGIAPSTQFSKMQTQVLFPPNLCLTHTFESGFGFGISAKIPYSSKTEWGPEWVGNTVVIGTEMRGVEVTPVLAFRPTPRISVGIGLNLISFRVRTSDLVPLANGSGGTVWAIRGFEGDAKTGYGVEMGITAKPIDMLSFGLVYKSPVAISITDGKVAYQSLPPDLVPQYPDKRFTSEFTLPQQLIAGVALRPFAGLLLAGEWQYVLWSDFGSMDFRVEDGSGLVLTQQAGWGDVLTARAGVELRLPDVVLRAGYAFDHTPVPDPELSPSIPDANREVLSVGLGYEVGEGLTLDFAFQSIRYRERTVTTSRVLTESGTPFNGTYQLSATVVALNVSYSWK
jgi:long-chain fatty acid transport protein